LNFGFSVVFWGFFPFSCLDTHLLDLQWNRFSGLYYEILFDIFEPAAVDL